LVEDFELEINEFRADNIPDDPSIWESLTHPAYARSTWVGIFLGITNQLTTITILSQESTPILT
jgi:hypothetical protein